jgi:hypothetical protein
MAREPASPPGQAHAGPLFRLSPDRLAEELSQHGRSPVTWLIGAGFSHSAGLPLSSEVWQLLALSWLHRRRGRPDGSDDGPRRLDALFRGARDLLPFTISPGGVATPAREKRHQPGVPEEIDTDAAQLRDDLLRALSELRDRAGPAQRAALSPGRDDLSTYQAVFDLAAPTPESRRAFLSALLSARGAGPNLCHLLLAHLLCEERGPRMHTVFTVNFDDLLLESLVTLRKQARVFTDPGLRGERPQLCPPSPQIVHLHGRGPSYLGGFGGAGAAGPVGDSDDLFDSFHEHLRESSLIVCGYGGGDERILAALRRWLSGGDRSGPLYWVLHDDSHGEAVAARLSGGSFSPALRERVRLVVAPAGGTLSADEVLVELCEALLPRGLSPGLSLSGGGLPDALAELVRKNGRRLQGALGQLSRDFPGRDPVVAHLRAVSAGSPGPFGPRDPQRNEERRRHLSAAAELARAADVPAWRAQVRMAEMREHFFRGEIEKAQVAAEAARLAALEAEASRAAPSSLGLLRAQTHGLAGELALYLGRLGLGRERLMRLLHKDEAASCPPEWRTEARAQLLAAVLRACHRSPKRDSGLLDEARALLDLRVDTAAAAVHSLIYEAEIYFLHGDLRRALLVYETADEVAGRHAALSPLLGGASAALSLLPAHGLSFSAPAPGEAESEASLLLAARQARFGLLMCRVAASRDAGTLPGGYLEDVDRFISQHAPPAPEENGAAGVAAGAAQATTGGTVPAEPKGAGPGDAAVDGEAQGMAAALLYEAAVFEHGLLRRAESHAEAAQKRLGPQTPPWRAAQTLRTAAAIALLAGRLDDAERHARAAQRPARATEQYDEEGRLNLLLSQIYRARGRRAAKDERQRSLRRAVAHAEAAWLLGLELGSTFLTEDADDLLSTLRSAPTEISEDVTPVPGEI